MQFTRHAVKSDYQQSGMPEVSTIGQITAHVPVP
jgi:hypothetical protein